MRLKYNETKKGKCYYVIHSVYKNGKNTSETFEKLGYLEEIMKEHGCDDPMKWMEEHLDKLNEAEKSRSGGMMLVPYSPAALILKHEIQSFNVGYLFLQRVYYLLRMDLVASHITKRHLFQYDMNAILSRLIYGRILCFFSQLFLFHRE